MPVVEPTDPRLAVAASLTVVPTRWADVDGDVVVLDLRTGASHALMGGASMVWRALVARNGMTAPELLDVLDQQLDGAAPRGEVMAVVADLLDRGLVSTS